MKQELVTGPSRRERGAPITVDEILSNIGSVPSTRLSGSHRRPDIEAPLASQPPVARLSRADRKLRTHVADIFTSHPLAARAFSEQLDTFSPADPTGSVDRYRAALAELSPIGEPPTGPELAAAIRLAGATGTVIDLDPEPAAAGDLSHVYRATWLDGRPVAVKVADTRAARFLRSDIAAASARANDVAKFLPGVPVGVFFQQISQAAAGGMDLLAEARRQHDFHRLAAGIPSIAVPAVRLAAPGLLVTDWVTGMPLDVATAGMDAATRAIAAAAILQFTAASVHATGMLHAQMSSGNILIDKRGRVTIVDFGVVAPLPVRLLDAPAALADTAVRGDAQGALRVLSDLDMDVRKAQAALRIADGVTSELIVRSAGLSAADMPALVALFQAPGTGQMPPELASALYAALGALGAAARLGVAAGDVSRAFDALGSRQ